MYVCMYILGVCEKTHFSCEAPDAMLIAFTLHKHTAMYKCLYACMM